MTLIPRRAMRASHVLFLLLIPLLGCTFFYLVGRAL